MIELSPDRGDRGDVAPRVSGIFIYPLKGAGGIPVPAAELDALGFRWDRRWMIVDEAGDFVSQRTRPRLALIRLALAPGVLVLEAPGQPRLELAPEPTGRGTEPVRVWADTLAALPAGDAADRWISGYLGERARIVGFAPDAVRAVDPRYARRPTDRVAFVDAFPCLLITQASLDLLNQRLPDPVPMDRFRPNLVVGGTGPHAEDGWRRIRVGDVVFDVVKPCARCVVTTVDQRAGVAGEEPLRTLATYRKVGSKVLFGQNLIHDGPGTVHVGARVEVEARVGA